MNDSIKQNEAAPALGVAPGSGWAFASSQDAEQWNGPCPTRQDAIAAALDYYGDEDEPDCPVWISECRPVNETDTDADEEWTFMLTGKLERVTAADLSSPNYPAQPRDERSQNPTTISKNRVAL